MYATVRRYEGVTRVPEVAKSVREGFLPLLRTMNGFVAFYWVDAGDGIVISTSVFQTRAAAEESNRKAAEWLRTNLPEQFVKPPQITAGVVGAAGQSTVLPAEIQGGREEALRH